MSSTDSLHCHTPLGQGRSFDAATGPLGHSGALEQQLPRSRELLFMAGSPRPRESPGKRLDGRWPRPASGPASPATAAAGSRGRSGRQTWPPSSHLPPAVLAPATGRGVESDQLAPRARPPRRRDRWAPLSWPGCFSQYRASWMRSRPSLSGAAGRPRRRAPPSSAPRPRCPPRAFSPVS